MSMLPILPPYADETTVSWCARVARFHTGLPCADFLHMMEISQAHVKDLSDYAVERLSKLTGVSEEQVLGCGPQKVGDRLLTYQGETFGPAFMTRTHTTYCPACLIDDATEEANGDRVGRLSWMLASVRVCPRHGIILTRRRNVGHFERFQDMDRVAPSVQELAEQVENAGTASVSPLQTYVVDRLSGMEGPRWMDGQRIDQAARACEMLGVCRIRGAHADIDDLTIQQWDEAGAVGMEAVSQGPEGIYRILESIVQEAIIDKRWGGAPSALGRIYDWLQLNKSKQDPGPIQDVVRDFIIDHMPVEPGTVLFGGKVLKRKRHTVATLSKVSRLHQKILNRALVITGLLADGDPEHIEIRKTFDAVDGEALALRIKNSTPIKKIPDYLNCNRTQAQMMVQTGLLKKLADDPSITGGVLSSVANDDLDEFLIRFRANGRRVAVASPGMTDVIKASEIARVPAADIVALVLEERLSKVEVGDDDLRFRSVFVDADEVRSAAGDMVAEQGLSAKEAADRIGLRLLAIERLRTAMDVAGQPFLKATMITNARGTIRYCYAKEDLDEFRAKYVTLQEIADRNGVGTKSMSLKLTRAGIEPIVDRSLLGAKVFRRKDL
ncbi:TniQ family protein [Rhodobacteraceae bacterium LMO-12]|nr:TniQ family protein [Rhodobacteraceae bacterium LMO-JJ12]